MGLSRERTVAGRDAYTMKGAYKNLRRNIRDAEREGLAFFVVFGCVDQTDVATTQFAHPRHERHAFFLDACAEAAQIAKETLT